MEAKHHRQALAPRRADAGSPTIAAVRRHLALLGRCRLCPQMHRPVVVGRPVASRIILVGQAPGDKEPKLGRPFAWTAGRTLFRWFQEQLGWTEDETRDRIYFAAVCRCFPGKKTGGGDRVPGDAEIANCSRWLAREFALLRPHLVLPVGRLAIRQFLGDAPLAEIVGRQFPGNYRGFPVDLIPLPHPSGASPWHRMEPGKSLLRQALERVGAHPAIKAAAGAAAPARDD